MLWLTALEKPAASNLAAFAKHYLIGPFGFVLRHRWWFWLVFGTKVLIDYLEGGDTLDQFLEQYLSVTREVAIAAIEEARLSLVSQLQ